MTKLHADWPEYTDRAWNGNDPHEELVSAFDDNPIFSTAAVPSVTVSPVTFEDIESVEAYHFESDGMGGDGGVWVPGASISTELTAVVVGKLKDGRFFAASMWNDYTGWGCQSGTEFKVADDRDSILRFGLTDEERTKLGFAVVGSTPEGQKDA